MKPWKTRRNLRPRRRWFQYKLRTLLIAMTLASVGMSWFVARMQRAKRQREAVEAILSNGWCDVVYDNDSRDVYMPDLVLLNAAVTGKPPPAPPPAPWIESSLGKDFCRSAVGVGIPLSHVGEMLPAVRQLPDLQKVLILVGEEDGDEELKAAIRQVEQAVPGVDVVGLQWDLEVD
jgi:hypothetical protein